MRRRPVNTPVTVPVPSDNMISSVGTPLRGAMMTRVTSPPTRTGVRSGTVSSGVSPRPENRVCSREPSSSATEAPRRVRNV